MRIALCQMNPTVGDLDGNAATIALWAQAAADEGADLAVFPELAICGYPPEDLLLRPAFLRKCHRLIEELATTLPIPALVGYPELGTDLFNSCAVIADGRVQASYRKQHLPNYGVFDEHRYFARGSTPALIELRRAGTTPSDDGGDPILVGLTICEDIWLASGPAELEAAAGAQIVVNLSASPYRRGRGIAREQLLHQRALDSGAYVALCNQVGAQDELVFDGHSVVIDPDGVTVARAGQFAAELLLVGLEPHRSISARLADTRLRADHLHETPVPIVARITVGGYEPAVPASANEGAELGSEQARPALDASSPVVIRSGRPAELLDPEAELYEALVTGLRDYTDKNRFPGVVLGLSGGIDSAFTLALAVDALGADRVHAVTMPSRYSSQDTLGDAHYAAQSVGVRIDEIAIEPIFTAFTDSLAPLMQGREPDATEENLQARIRGTLLMALSNKFGDLVLTNGNKSETSTGYTTLYGDMAGGFAPIKDVPKTTLYALANWRNAKARKQGKREPIPQTIIERPPTAELRHGQKDSDSLPPYELLDQILEQYVEHDRGRRELRELGFDAATVARVTDLVDRAEYKRRQAPPGIRVTAKAFGRDRRMPITNRFGAAPTDR